MKTTNKIISLIIAAAIAGGGLVAEDQFNKDIQLAGEVYSASEYRVIRTEIADRASRDAFNEYAEIQLYAELLNIEKENCKGKLYPFESHQDIRNMLKRFDEEGCP